MSTTTTTTITRRTFNIRDIQIGERLRGLHTHIVVELADSIRQLGQMTLISVRMIDGVPHLVAGLHRLEARRRLGHETIDAAVFEDEFAARLWEIDENLKRAQLDDDEQAEHIADRIELMEKYKPAHGGQVSKGGRGKKGGKSALARELGYSRQKVERAVKFRRLLPEAKIEAKRLGLEHDTKALAAATCHGTPEMQVRQLQSDYEDIQQRAAKKARITEIKTVATAMVKGTVEDAAVREVIDRHCVMPLGAITSLANKASALAAGNNPVAMRAGLYEIAHALNVTLREHRDAA